MSEPQQLQQLGSDEQEIKAVETDPNKRYTRVCIMSSILALELNGRTVL
jgi:hypothetical protein